MNEQFKKLTDEIRTKLAEHFAGKEVQKTIEQIKAAEDTGSFEVVVSTADVDRAGETIDQNGWDLSFYKQNPIVLWAHDYFGLPIGVTTSIEVVDGKLVAKGKFAPADANPLAQQIRKLYDLKIVRATSVGFIPKEMDGDKILSAELLEFSFVPVPANPYALSLMKRAKLEKQEIAELMTKGIVVKIDEPAEPATTHAETGKENKESEPVGEPIKEDEEDIESEEHNEPNTGDKSELTEPKAIKDFIITENIEAETALIELVYTDQSKSKPVAITKEFLETLRKFSAGKAGRVLSERNRKLIFNTVVSLQESVAALQELLNATEGSQGEETGTDTRSLKPKVGPAGVTERDVADYILIQRVLRSINTSSSDALAQFNQRTRKK